MLNFQTVIVCVANAGQLKAYCTSTCEYPREIYRFDELGK
ncbi:rCG43666 [Rattus norvegicus]|uniref:RCG43666 n=1 Tax=Rattus norvegicus TaxID=10116 RepID=A6JID1_RAT|nr:rCG43666 [Rattus norvegicus]